MTAGQPNWQKLAELGKLPKSARNKIPLLDQLDKVSAEIERVKNEICDDCRERIFGADSNSGATEIKCEVDGCEFVAKGRTPGIARNSLNLHSRSHITKEE